MKHVIAISSIVLGVIICFIVFPDYVYKPPLAILILSLLGIVLNAIALADLIYLFAALGR